MESASGAEYLPDPGVHLLFLDEFATICLFQARSHGGSEARVTFEELQRRVSYELLGADPFPLRDLRERSSFLGREMNFHNASVGNEPIESRIIQ